VCARGGFELDFAWENKQLQKVTVRSKAGKICKLKYGDKTREFETKKGSVYVLDWELEIL
ncbi:MAG: hypothetical protein KAQ62_10345, partial [Cyclobacteriaceae bacterium]|nr:hypothetical protein [Cyclobacteriaceae bacterium]